MEDNLDVLSGARWFASLDLANGYWQVEMAEEDKPKKVFYPRYSLWE